MKKLKWTVQFEIDECWVEDGFNLTDDRALDMLSNDLRHAHIDSELRAKVIKAPAPERIAKLQGYKDASHVLKEIEEGKLS